MPTPSAPAPRPEVAVGGIAVVDGALLLVQRGTAPQAGFWTLPGGRVEPGETVTAAVERELFEETALRVVCGSFVGFAERRGKGYHYVILDFDVTVDGPTVPRAGSDARDVAWVPIGDVATLPLADGLEAFLERHGVL